MWDCLYGQPRSWYLLLSSHGTCWVLGRLVSARPWSEQWEDAGAVRRASGCGFGAVLLSGSPVRPESPHKHLWVICCIIPSCSNVFYLSSDDISDVDVAVVFPSFNSQGGPLFMATLLAKKMGEQ